MCRHPANENRPHIDPADHLIASLRNATNALKNYIPLHEIKHILQAELADLRIESHHMDGPWDDLADETCLILPFKPTNQR